MGWTPTGENLRGPQGLPGPSGPSAPPAPRVVVIEEPATSDQFFLWKNTTGAAVTISRLVATTRGVGSAFTFTLFYGPDWSASGTAVVTAGTLVTNTTTGVAVTSFDNATIPDGNLLWIVINSVTNGPQQACVQIEF